MKFYNQIEKIAMYRQNQFYEVTGELLMYLIIDDKFEALITLMARCWIPDGRI